MEFHPSSHQYLEGPFVEQTWEFERPEFRELLDYWKDRRQDRAAPRWRDVDLLAVYRLAPFITVKDALDGGTDFRNRYWGTQVAEWLRFDGTGRRLSDYFPKATLPATLAAHRLALHSDMPVRRWGVSAYPKRDHVAFEVITLALEDDAGNRAHLLSMSHYQTIEPTDAEI